MGLSPLTSPLSKMGKCEDRREKTTPPQAAHRSHSERRRPVATTAADGGAKQKLIPAARIAVFPGPRSYSTSRSSTAPNPSAAACRRHPRGRRREASLLLPVVRIAVFAGQLGPTRSPSPSEGWPQFEASLLLPRPINPLWSPSTETSPNLCRVPVSVDSVDIRAATGNLIQLISVLFLGSDCFSYWSLKRLVIYLYKCSQQPAFSLQKFASNFYRRNLSVWPKLKISAERLCQICQFGRSSRYPMQSCSVARILSLGKLAIHRMPGFRVLPKLLGFTPSSLKRFCRDEHIELQLTKKTTLGTLPELPPDILMGIFATLEIPDLVRAGSVCSSWRSAYTSLRSLGQYKLQQTPCLLYTSESAGESVACLYSLAEKRSYKLTLPEPPIRTRCLIGSSHGWLVTVDDRSEMHLINPITCEQIALPSVITIKQVKPIVDECGALHKYEFSRHPGIFALDKLRHELHYKAFVFPDTSTGSYIVVLIHNPVRQLSFARVGDDKWTWLPPYDDYKDCTYKDGLLHAACTYKGELHTFDLSGPVVTRKTIISIPGEHDCEYMYVVQAPWGGLLLIWRIFEDYNVEPEPGASVFWNTTEYRIYEFDAAGSELKEINCLRDHVLFLGHNQSLCLAAEEYPSLRSNHVYFTDDNSLWTCGLKNTHRDMGVLNLDDNSREDLVSPQLWSNFPAPMWITPDLRKMNLASAGIAEN